jgi:hypothetical protein
MEININGHWEGKIIYGAEYDKLEHKELYFSMDIIQDLDAFTGIALDKEGIGVNPDKATIKGFIDGNEISFVKQYESTAWFDENDLVVIEKNKLSPEINYFATFDPLTNVIEGHWDVVISSQPFGNDWLDDISTGSFSMRRI